MQAAIHSNHSPRAMAEIRRIVPLCLTFLLLMAGCAAPSSPPMPVTPPTPTSIPRTIVVVGNGNMRVQSNLSQINMAVDVLDASVQNASRIARQTTQQVMETLQAQGIAAEDIKTSSYTVNVERNIPGIEPPDQHPAATEIPVGEVNYRVTYGLQVFIREPNELGPILDAAIEAGGNNFFVNGVDFLYDDPDSLEHPAREKAMADADAKAQEIARLTGMEVGPVLAISEIVQHSGVYWDNYIAPLWPGQLQFYMLLQVTYAANDAAGTATSKPTTIPVTPIAASPAPVTATTEVTPPLTPSGVHTQAVTIHGGDEASTREFLRHYLIQPFGSDQETRINIYIGTLPPDSPVSLDLPDDLGVVGSVARQGEHSNFQLIFKTDQDVTESIARINEQLQSQGYTRMLDRSSGQAFQPQAIEFAPMCSPDGAFTILTSGAMQEDGTGIIHSYINAVAPFGSPCTAETPADQPPSSAFNELMPNLAAPAGISTYSSGMGESADGFDAYIGFRGTTTIAALAEHYNAELVAAGWQQLGASQTEEVAWSGWTKTQDEQQYRATFTLTRNAGSTDRFRATLHVERAIAR